MAGVKLGPERICCVIAQKESIIALDKTLCGLVEVRLDLVGIGQGISLIEQLANQGYKVIATLRDAREGGKYRGAPDEKLKVLNLALDKGAELVDVEYRFEALDEALSSMSGHVIVSVHYFSWTPQPEILYAVAGDILRRGARIAKIAATPRRMADNYALLGVNAKWPSRVIAMGMGRFGLFSRILAPIYGAPFTYAALGEKTAPGQPTPKEIIAAWSLLGLA